MNERRDAKSPWGVTLYFTEEDFERLAEEQIARAHAAAVDTGGAIDVDALLLATHGIDADYAELPVGVLGVTRFTSDGKCRVVLSRGLSDAAEHDIVQRRRLRTTLAHEYGHVVCHRSLFVELDPTPNLFGHAPNSRPDEILCRDANIARAGSETSYRGDWWEYQANRFMAALLLPRKPFTDRLRFSLDQRSLSWLPDPNQGPSRHSVIRSLAEEFDVNPQVVELRIQQLGLAPRDRNQTTLALG